MQSLQPLLDALLQTPKQTNACGSLTVATQPAPSISTTTVDLEGDTYDHDGEMVSSRKGAKRQRNGRLRASQPQIASDRVDGHDSDAVPGTTKVRTIPWHLMEPFDLWEATFRQDGTLIGDFFEFCVRCMTTATLLFDNNDDDGQKEGETPKGASSLTLQDRYALLMSRTQAITYLTKGCRFLLAECQSETPALRAISIETAKNAIPELIVYALPMIQSVYNDVSEALQDVGSSFQRELEPAQIASLAYVLLCFSTLQAAERLIDKMFRQKQARPVFLNAFNIFNRLMAQVPGILTHLQSLPPNVTDTFIEQTQKSQQRTQKPIDKTACLSVLMQFHTMLTGLCRVAAVDATEASQFTPRSLSASERSNMQKEWAEQSALLVEHIGTLLEKSLSLLTEELVDERETTVHHTTFYVTAVLDIMQLDPGKEKRLRLWHRLMTFVSQRSNLLRDTYHKMDGLSLMLVQSIRHQVEKVQNDAEKTPKATRIASFILAQLQTLLPARCQLTASLLDKELTSALAHLRAEVMLLPSLKEVRKKMDALFRSIYMAESRPCPLIVDAFLADMSAASTSMHHVPALSLLSLLLHDHADCALAVRENLTVWEPIIRSWMEHLQQWALRSADAEKEAFGELLVSSASIFYRTASPPLRRFFRRQALSSYLTVASTACANLLYHCLAYIYSIDAIFAKQVNGWRQRHVTAHFQQNVSRTRWQRLLSLQKGHIAFPDKEQLSLPDILHRLDGLSAHQDLVLLSKHLTQHENQNPILLAIVHLRLFGARCLFDVALFKTSFTLFLTALLAQLDAAVAALQIEESASSISVWLRYEAGQAMPVLIRTLRRLNLTKEADNDLLDVAHQCMHRLSALAFHGDAEATSCTILLFHVALSALTTLKILPPELTCVVQDVFPVPIKTLIGTLAHQTLPPPLADLSTVQEHSAKSVSLSSILAAAPPTDFQHHKKLAQPDLIDEQNENVTAQCMTTSNEDMPTKEKQEDHVKKRSWKDLTREMRDVLDAHQHRFSLLQKEKIREQLLTLLSIIDQ